MRPRAACQGFPASVACPRRSRVGMFPARGTACPANDAPGMPPGSTRARRKTPAHPLRAAGLAALLVLALGAAAEAYIERLYGLQEFLDQSQTIVVGRIESADARRRIAVAVIERALKGAAEFKRVEMHIGLSAPDHSAYVIGRLKPGGAVIGFARRDGMNIASEWHAGDTWFQLYAEDDPGARDRLAWRMSHVEIRLNRTYSGTTADLVGLVEDVLAKRRPAPAPDPTLPPVDPSRPLPRRLDPSEARGGLRRRLVFPCEGAGEPGGLAPADANADERIDIYACRRKAGVLLVSGGGAFEDMAAALHLREGARSAAWADYNGDGYPDVLLGALRLFTNAGAGFRDDSRLLPAPPATEAAGAAWIDFNGDGLPDVLVADARAGLRLFQNAGKGPAWFAEATGKAGLAAKEFADAGEGLLAFDYDGDGYTDFFSSQGVLAHNMRNGTFEPVAGSGLEPCRPAYPCGPAAGDMDNDGRLDVFVPRPGKARLYRNNGDGTFADVIDASGDLGRATEPSVSAAWADADGDGRLDLLVCYAGGPPRLFLGDGKGGFTDSSDAVGLQGLEDVSAAAWADLDGDGYPDLALNGRDRIVVAFNEIEHPKDRVALTVEADVRRGFTGALVRAMDEKGRLLGLRELGGAEGGGQTCPIAHFAVPAGRCQVSVCLSDGRAAIKIVKTEPGKHRVVFREDEFK